MYQEFSENLKTLQENSYATENAADTYDEENVGALHHTYKLGHF